MTLLCGKIQLRAFIRIRTQRYASFCTCFILLVAKRIMRPNFRNKTNYHGVVYHGDLSGCSHTAKQRIGEVR